MRTSSTSKQRHRSSFSWHKLTKWNAFVSYMLQAHQEERLVHGRLTFTSSSFDEMYSILDRTYEITSHDCFREATGAVHVWGSCMKTGKFVNVGYFVMNARWEVESCWIFQEDS